MKPQDQQIGGIGGIGVSDWEAEANKIAEDLAAKGAPSMGLGQNSHTAKLIAGIANKVCWPVLPIHLERRASAWKEERVIHTTESGALRATRAWDESAMVVV